LFSHIRKRLFREFKTFDCNPKIPEICWYSTFAIQNVVQDFGLRNIWVQIFLGSDFITRTSRGKGENKFHFYMNSKSFFKPILGFQTISLGVTAKGWSSKGLASKSCLYQNWFCKKKNKHLRECQLVISFLFYSLKYWNVMVSKINSLFAQKIVIFYGGRVTREEHYVSNWNWIYISKCKINCLNIAMWYRLADWNFTFSFDCTSNAWQYS
jgi:hypothetical protein